MLENSGPPRSPWVKGGMEENALLARVKTYIEKNRLLERGDRVLLSLSAGKDSIMLLECMGRLMDDYALDVGIFHLNHQLRGAESDREEEFIRNQRLLTVSEIIIERYDFNDDTAGGSLEERARNIRYRLLERLAKERGYTRIATAHSGSDNAETLLMRLLRGTGITGLKGIALRRGTIIRPLLCLYTDEIYDYLQHRGLEWMEDSSNADDAYLRNYLRIHILPAIRGRLPGADDALNRLGRLAEEHEGMVEELLEAVHGKIYEAADGFFRLRLKAAADRRALKFMLPVLMGRHFPGVFMTRNILEEICRRLDTDKTHLELYAGNGVVIKKTIAGKEPVIEVKPREGKFRTAVNLWEYRIELTPGTPGEVSIKETGLRLRFELSTRDFYRSNRSNRKILFIDLKEKIGYIFIRNRRAGDTIRLEAGSRKIKDLMIDYKLSPEEKSSMPLIIAGGDVAAVMTGVKEGNYHRVSREFYVRDDSKKILAIYKADN